MRKCPALRLSLSKMSHGRSPLMWLQCNAKKTPIRMGRLHGLLLRQDHHSLQHSAWTAILKLDLQDDLIRTHPTRRDRDSKCKSRASNPATKAVRPNRRAMMRARHNLTLRKDSNSKGSHPSVLSFLPPLPAPVLFCLLALKVLPTLSHAQPPL